MSKKIYAALLAVVMIAVLSGVALGQEVGVVDRPDISEQVRERVNERLKELDEFKNDPELARERKEKPLEEKVYVRGEAVNFEDFGQVPIIREGRTLVPLRTINAYLGADTEWDSELEKVTIFHGDTTIEMIIGETEVTVDGDTYEIDVPGKITENNRTVVPLRFISDILGESVDYLEETGDVDVGLAVVEEEAEEEADTKRPDEVVNEFWKLYADGQIQEANEKVIGEETFEIRDIEDVDESFEIDERFWIEAFGYEIKDGVIDEEIEDEVAIVDFNLTKPNFREAINEYFEKATNKALDLEQQGMSEAEIEERILEAADDIMLEAMQVVDTITHEETVELHLIDGEWKIYEWNFDTMERRWRDLEEELEFL